MHGNTVTYIIIIIITTQVHVGVRLICSKFFLLFYSIVLINFPYYSFDLPDYSFYSIDYAIFSVEITRFIKILLFF